MLSLCSHSEGVGVRTTSVLLRTDPELVIYISGMCVLRSSEDWISLKGLLRWHLIHTTCHEYLLVLTLNRCLTIDSGCVFFIGGYQDVVDITSIFTSISIPFDASFV